LTLLTFSGCLSINGRVPVQFLHFSDDGSMLVSLTEFVHTTSGEGGHMLQIWDVKTGSELFSKYIPLIQWNNEVVVYFSPDNNYIILPNSVNKNDNTCIFDWRNNEIITEFPEKFHDWSDDGKYLSLEKSDHNITILDAATFEVLQEINITIDAGQTMSFSPNTSELAFIKNNENVIYLYNISTESINKIDNSSFSFQNNSKPELYFLQWSTDGSKIGLKYDPSRRALAGLYIWDCKNSSLITKKQLYSARTPVFSPNFNKYGYFTRKQSNKDTDQLEILSVNNTFTDTTIFTVETEDLSRSNYKILDWSHLTNRIAIGNDDGIITILDGSSGEVVQTLKTPEFSMAAP